MDGVVDGIGLFVGDEGCEVMMFVYWGVVV